MWISPLNIYKRYTTWFFKSVQKPFFAALVGFLKSGTLAAFVTKQLISYAISYVIQKAFAPDEPSQEQQADPGIAARIQSDPSNKLPVVYGERQVAGSTTMADISSNNQKMAFIISLCEGPVEGINTVIWQDKTLTFDGNISTGLRSVTNSTDGDGGTDDFLNSGRMKVRVYPNGGTCSHMSTFSSKWASKTRPMTNVAYAYVELTYDREKRVSGLPNQLFFNVKGRKVRAISNATTLATATYSTNPAECLLDYLTNDSYGCDISLGSIDLPSLYAHKTFCNELKSYTNESNVSASASRYTTNGVINTSSALDRNIKNLTIGNSSVFNWNLGKFGVITDKVKTSVKSFDTTNIFGGIDITGTGFDSKINKLTARYDEKQNKGLQAQLIAKVPSSNKNDNEPLLEQTISFPFTNNNIEAERAGYILLNQSRQALAASFTTDLSALAVQAGDVVDITHDVPNWNAKKFKVVSVTEVVDNGAIQLRMAVQEYASSVYDDRSINEFDSAPNTNYPSPYTAPVLTGLVLTSDSDLTEPNIILNWVDANSVFTSSYVVEYRINGTTDAYSLRTVEGGQRYTLTGITTAPYEVRVYGVSALGVKGPAITAVGSSGDVSASAGTNILTDIDVSGDTGALGYYGTPGSATYGIQGFVLTSDDTNGDNLFINSIDVRGGRQRNKAVGPAQDTAIDAGSVSITTTGSIVVGNIYGGWNNAIQDITQGNPDKDTVPGYVLGLPGSVTLTANGGITIGGISLTSPSQIVDPNNSSKKLQVENQQFGQGKVSGTSEGKITARSIDKNVKVNSISAQGGNVYCLTFTNDINYASTPNISLIASNGCVEVDNETYTDGGHSGACTNGTGAFARVAAKSNSTGNVCAI